MPNIAIVGAGPQLGMAIARAFGRRQFRVAMVSRDLDQVYGLAAQLRDEGIDAEGFTADVRDTDMVAEALADADQWLGSIDVLEFSPLPAEDFLQPVLETTREHVQAAFEFSVLGPMAAVAAVLPGMRAAGEGSLLFTTGGSALVPNPRVAGTSMAMAAEAAYLTMLHESLAPEGVYVGHLVVPVRIAPGEPLGDPDALAERLWELHEQRQAFRVVVSD